MDVHMESPRRRSRSPRRVLSVAATHAMEQIKRRTSSRWSEGRCTTGCMGVGSVLTGWGGHDGMFCGRCWEHFLQDEVDMYELCAGIEKLGADCGCGQQQCNALAVGENSDEFANRR